jgi:hypothetical protein
MKWPTFLTKDKPGAQVAIEVEVRNLKDLERMECIMDRFARHTEKAADASERLADALERAGMGKITNNEETS